MQWRRVVLTRVIEIDGEPWFVAADVCRVLALPVAKGVYSHLLKLGADEKQRVTPHLARGNDLHHRSSAISESGLYKLIMRSDKPRNPRGPRA